MQIPLKIRAPSGKQRPPRSGPGTPRWDAWAHVSRKDSALWPGNQSAERLSGPPGQNLGLEGAIFRRASTRSRVGGAARLT